MKLSSGSVILAAALTAPIACTSPFKLNSVQGVDGDVFRVPEWEKTEGKPSYCTLEASGYRVDYTKSDVLAANISTLRAAVRTQLPTEDTETVVNSILGACIRNPYWLDIPGADGCGSSCIDMGNVKVTGRIGWSVRENASKEVAEDCQRRADKCTHIDNWRTVKKSLHTDFREEIGPTSPEIICSDQVDDKYLDKVSGDWLTMVTGSLQMKGIVDPEKIRAHVRDCASSALIVTTESLDKCPSSYDLVMKPLEEEGKLRPALDSLNKRKAPTLDYAEYWKKEPGTRSVNDAYLRRYLPKFHGCLTDVVKGK